MSERPGDGEYLVVVTPEGHEPFAWEGFAENTSDALLRALSTWEESPA